MSSDFVVSSSAVVPPSVPKVRRVLYVDDEGMARSLVKAMLSRFAYHLDVCESGLEARQILQRKGEDYYDCILTDYNMPQENGIDLLKYFHREYPTISVILLTAVGDRSVVKEALKEGAVDFIDKPISQGELVLSLEKAFSLTDRMHHLLDTAQAVSRVEAAQEQILGLPRLMKNPHLVLTYLPKHEAGGDFFDYFQIDEDRQLYIIADISGHDLRAAYISAYFKGIVRGMVESSRSVEEILLFFNEFLFRDWNSGDNKQVLSGTLHTSLAVCIVDLNHTTKAITSWTAGMPSPLLVTADGEVLVLSEGSSPLGWDVSLDYDCYRGDLSDADYIYMWSDGIEDLALHSQQPLDTLLYLSTERNLNSGQREAFDAVTEMADDDILVARVDTQPSLAPNERFQLVLNRSYAPEDESKMNEVSATWEAALIKAIPDVSRDRLFDVLLAVREMLLNSLKHGCHGIAGAVGRLSFLYQANAQVLRVRCEDPGEGHSDDYLISEVEDSVEERNAGFILIKMIATRIISERRGALLLVDFNLS